MALLVANEACLWKADTFVIRNRLFRSLLSKRAYIFYIFTSSFQFSKCDSAVFEFYSNSSCNAFLPLHPIWCKVFLYLNVDVDLLKCVSEVTPIPFSRFALGGIYPVPYMSCFGMPVSFKRTKFPDHLSRCFRIIGSILIKMATRSSLVSGTSDRHEFLSRKRM